jgi:hypothetical protein
MKAERLILAYQRLRGQPLWRLLVADHAPAIIALLQTHLLGTEQSVPASIFHERIDRDLEELRARGENLPQTAQAYVADWLRSGYLERRFPDGATEERYELSAAATSALRFVANLVDPRTAATESRLSTVIQQLLRLAEESDPDPRSRVAALRVERERIEREIEEIEKGRFEALSDERALERMREIIGLADELAGDFRHVRDRFENLNRELRERVMDNDGNRGDVLEELFAGVDVIAESEAGRTFSAFWRLLTDPIQSVALDQALDQILGRPFAEKTESRERRFLLRLTRTLLDEGGRVHEVLQYFARSLKHFVQSREYLEQRRLNQLLKDAQRLALSIKEEVGAQDPLGYTLELTSGRLRSLAQWSLFDPSLHALTGGMTDGEGAPVDLETVSAWVAQSEIDFRTLKANIRAILEERSQISIGELLTRFPAMQGLGTVVGYLALANQHGIRTEGEEKVSWRGYDRERRSARIPVLYFLKERIHEL